MEVWTKTSGSTLATLDENITTTVPLPISTQDATIEIISGKLPPGMYIRGFEIAGTPREVARDTKFRFVIRATYEGHIDDRTYNIEIKGPDQPEWITDPDLLPAGNNDTYYILDSAPVEFQLEVLDTDIEAGQVLEYYIPAGGGELPPGIQLTTDGRLVGIVDPLLAIEKAAGTGGYDEVGYDFKTSTGYDWSIRPANGYESYFYDTTTYDLSIPTKSPKKLNRFYQFTVNVSDGDTIASRTFRLFVVGDDFFRADTTLMNVGTGIFSADNTHVRVPIWLTPSNFGFRRANNYVTLVLDVIDPNTLTGVVSYYLKSKNPDNTDSILPPGLSLDVTSGEIAGRVPYQPAVTREYNFTVAAQRLSVDVDRVQLQKYAVERAPKGANQILLNKFDPDYVSLVVGRSFTFNGFSYEVIAIDPSNPSYDRITLDLSLKNAVEESQSIDLGFVSIAEPEVAVSEKTFKITLIGEIDSTIKWLTDSDLGSYSANYISTLSVKAETNVTDAFLLYELVSGTLPPGLSLSFDGEIIGKVSSFGTAQKPGLTVFDSQLLKFDNNETRFDRTYTFTVNAFDQFGFSAIQRTFTITLSDPDNKLYSNVFAKPLLTQDKRISYEEFVNNAEIFLPEYIYRPNDPNFGLQRSLQMLVYAGIESKNVREFVAAAAKNVKRKSYLIGELKTAVAKNPGEDAVVYEVVYLEIKDPAQSTKAGKKVKNKIKIKNNKPLLINNASYTNVDEDYDSIPNKYTVGTRALDDVTSRFTSNLKITGRDLDYLHPVGSQFTVTPRDATILDIDFIPGVVQSTKLRPDNPNVLTVDSDAINSSATIDDVRYISNITSMRDALKEIGETEINFLPLWMRTEQEDTIGRLGFINAIPLCYCQPGTSKIIKNTIEFYNIDFKIYDFDIDRYIIDSSEGVSEDQYVVFANYNFNV